MDSITSIKTAVALLVAFAIGGLCGRFQVPLPAPPHWVGVALIVAIWLGYVCFKRE